MKRTISATAALLATTAAASAGGIERANQSVAFLFEQGSYAEFSISRVSPDVSGTATFGPFAGAQSGDMTGGYTSLGFAYKTDLNDRLSLGIQFEQPYGADVDYAPGTAYPYSGSNADLDTSEVKLLLKYKMDGGFSVYGGLRMQNVDGNVNVVVPAASLNYNLVAPNQTKHGYLVGVAYEKPEIAMRIALTYNSAITQEFQVTEDFSGGLAPGVPTSFETEFPQSLTLEAQTGIAEGTLLLGSVRWVNWSAFDITPTLYGGAIGSLVDYEDDVITYTLGIARRFTDDFAGIATISYENANGGFAGNLGPTDGRTSIGLAGRYTVGKATITGGINYSWIGDAQTQAPAAFTGGAVAPLADFEDNTALGVGIRVGYNF